VSKFQKKATLRGLVMTRKSGDKISINHGELLIEVLEIRGNQVRLVFQGDKEINVQRYEREERFHERDRVNSGNEGKGER
jgi:carbon storage regulator CsrA